MFESNKVELTTEQEKKLTALIVGPDEDIFMSDYHEKQTDLEYDIMPAIKRLLKVCGEDPTREGLVETPFRFAKALIEHTRGYAEDPSKHLEKTFDVDHNELVLVKDIEFNSLCEHHLAPFYGVAHVGYIPGNKITGLSKLARVVEGYAQRLQVQERLTSQIADAIETVLQAQGVMVVIEAKHTCMCSRGIKKSTASTTTSAVRGAFKEETSARAEFLSLIQ